MIVDSSRPPQIHLTDGSDGPGGRPEEPPCPPSQFSESPGEDELDPSPENQAPALANLEQKLDELITATETQFDRTAELAARDEVLTNLHRRLAAFEQDEHVRGFVEPLVRKTAPMLRRLTELQAHARSAWQALPKDLRIHSPYYWAYKALKSLRAELETLLNDFGVEIFEASDGHFDRSCQTVIEKIPTSNQQRAGTVSHSVAPGFKVGDRVIVSQRVAVFTRSN